MLQAPLEQITRTEQDTLKFRLLVLLIVAIAFAFLPAEERPVWPVAALVLFYVGYAYLLRYVIMPRYASTVLLFGMAGVDTATLALFLLLYREITSPLFGLLPLAVLYYGYYRGYASSLFMATTLSLSYIGVAVLVGQSKQLGPLLAAQIPLLYLLALFGGYLAQQRFQAIRVAENLQELLRLESRARGILEFARGLGETLDLERVLASVREQMQQLTGFPSAAILLVDSQREALTAAPGEGHRLPEEPLAGKTLGSLAMATRTPIVASREMEPALLPAWIGEGEATVAALPLYAGDQAVGLIYLWRTMPAAQTEEQDLRLGESYAAMAAHSVANARLHGQLRGRATELVGELQSTIQHLERSRGTRQKTEIVVGDLRIDGPQKQVYLRGQLVPLSPTEFELLYVLAESTGTPLSQQTLLHRIWGPDYTGQANVVDVSIHRLRRKIDADRAGLRRIITIRGEGYMLVDPRVASRLSTPPRRSGRPPAR